MASAFSIPGLTSSYEDYPIPSPSRAGMISEPDIAMPAPAGMISDYVPRGSSGGGFLNLLKMLAASGAGGRTAANFQQSAPAINPREMLFLPSWTDPNLNAGTIGAATLAQAADQQAQQRGIEIMKAATAQHEAELNRTQAAQKQAADDALQRHIAGLQAQTSLDVVNAQSKAAQDARNAALAEQLKRDEDANAVLAGHFDTAKSRIENEFQALKADYEGEVKRQVEYQNSPELAAALNSKDKAVAKAAKEQKAISVAKQNAALKDWNRRLTIWNNSAADVGGRFEPSTGKVTPTHEGVLRGLDKRNSRPVTPLPVTPQIQPSPFVPGAPYVPTPVSITAAPVNSFVPSVGNLRFAESNMQAPQPVTPIPATVTTSTVAAVDPLVSAATEVESEGLVPARSGVVADYGKANARFVTPEWTPDTARSTVMAALAELQKRYNGMLTQGALPTTRYMASLADRISHYNAILSGAPSSPVSAATATAPSGLTVGRFRVIPQ